MEFWLQRAAVTAVWVLTVPAVIASSQRGSLCRGWAGAVRCLCLHSHAVQESGFTGAWGRILQVLRPYGMHRTASSHTPPKQSAVLNFSFSKKNTASIID